MTTTCRFTFQMPAHVQSDLTFGLHSLLYMSSLPSLSYIYYLGAITHCMIKGHVDG